MNINAYGAAKTSTTQTNATANAANARAGSSQLGMEDFMKLLATQLANQDPMKPMDDTQFISQMAQFTALQTSQTTAELTYAQYGASMVGKIVKVAHLDENGEYVEKAGIVEKVRLDGGKVQLTVDGKLYEMSAIMEVLTEMPKPDPDPDVKPDPDPDAKPDPKPDTEKVVKE